MNATSVSYCLCGILGLGPAAAQSLAPNRGDARVLGRYTEAIQQTRSALNARVGEGRRKATFELGLAAAEVERGNHLEGQSTLTSLLQRNLPDPVARGARIWLAKSYWWRGDYTQAQKSFEPLVVWARVHSSDGDAAEVLRQAGRLAAARLQWAEAEGLLDEAAGAARRSRDATTEVLARIDLAVVGRQLGVEREAALALERALDSAKAQGAVRGEVAALEELASLAIRRGELVDGREFAQRGVERARQTGMLAAESRLLLQLAGIKRVAGTVDGGLRLVEQALTLARQAGDLNSEASGLRWNGSIESQRGNIAAARQLYARAANIQRQGGSLGEAAESESDLASLDKGPHGPEKLWWLHRDWLTFARVWVRITMPRWPR
jgi:tetratricopeptide (TPR) repeat protein